ncbi:unnamed protein product [Scytosiphon promiscuus]
MSRSWPACGNSFQQLSRIMVLTLCLERAVLVRGTECLLGCTLMAMHPFDEEGLITWEERGACDYFSVGCDVSVATNAAPLYDSFCDPTSEGCLWASSTGTDGTSGCACDLCWGSSGGLVDGDHYYMQGYPIWTRIQCLTAALEYHGYDMSACVGQIVDSATMLCVEDPYEKSMVAASDCDLAEYSASNVDFWAACDWGGETRLAAEMFADGLLATTTPTTPAPVSALDLDPGTPAPTTAGVSSSTASEPAVPVDSSTGRDLATPNPAVAGISSSTASETAVPDGSTSTGPSSSLLTTLEPTTATGSDGEETNVTGTEGIGEGSDDGWSAGAIGGLVAFLLLIAGGAALACKFRNKIHCQHIQCQCCSRT